jgi:RHS repeat-associated protein
VQNYWDGVATPDPALAGNVAAGKVRFAKLNGTLEQNYEPNLPFGSDLLSCVSADNTFGAYGDITQTIARTDANCSFASAWLKTTTSSYCPGPGEPAISNCPDPSSRILGRLSRAQVTASAPGVVSQTRMSGFGYDARGLLTSETIEPDEPASSTLRLATSYQYNDPYANRTQSTVSGANPDGTIFSRTTSIGYDPRGRYVESTTNALGHVSTATHDARWGTVLSQTDPNTVPVSFGYDGFGRRISETRPDGTVTTIEYAACGGLNPCPALAKYTVRTQTSGAAPVKSYFDLLGRTVRVETVSLNGAAVYRDTEYDARGRVARSTLPYFAGAFVYWNTNGYDALSRLIQVTEADAGVTATSYQGLTTVVTRSGPGITARPRTSVKNAANQLVSITDSLYPAQSTTYQYDAFGNVTRVTDPVGNITLMSYDRRGRKETMADPDMGAWNYGYNSLGGLVRQTDAKGQVHTVAYDPLGRLQSRGTPEGTSSWTYDSAPLGGTGLLAKGRLASVTVSAPGGVQQSYGYDNLGRPASSTLTVDGESYITSTIYNPGNGQIETVTYPQTGFAVRRVYNANGYLFELRNAATNQLYWTASQDDAAGRLVQERLNSDLLTTDRSYDPAKGALTRINTYGAPGTAQDLRYDFDVLGNLLSRVDFLQGTTESFGYDTLDRLLSVTGPAPKSFQYNAIGNLTFKSDVGSYAYAGGKPHAVTQAGPFSYTYDPNGNQLTGPGRGVGYTSFNKPSSITKDGLVTSFTYDAGFSRVKKGNVNGTTVYVGKLYERVVSGTVIEHKHYIHGGAAPVAVYTQRNTGANDTRYLHTDHLGSIDTITDEAGGVVQRLSYDTHGKRRNPDWTDPIGPITALTPRGFTGHEMDDESGLINMNAREYDPVIGRFLTPDPFVQSPSNSQSYNRYSYVWNNPLASTDPSGYFNIFKKDDWKNFTSGTLERVGRNKYLGGLTQMGLLTHPFGFGIAYGASTGDWNTVGRAYATNAVLAASVWAGGAAWGAYGAYGGSILGAGIFVAESAAIGYTSSYATAWIYGASNDEARHAALLAAKRAAVMAGARVGYNALVGYDSTPKPGENRPGNTRYIPDESGRLQPQDIGRNVVLLNENYEGLDCSLCRDAFRQGSPLSRALNDVPGINAIGGLDDFLNNVVPTSMGDSLWFKGVTIPAAVFVTVPALLDGIPIYLIDPLGRQR